jgi:DNA repair protein RadC
VDYKSIRKWPEDERPRERLLKYGADKLSTAQLLAITLRTGGRNRTAVELATEILITFKDLKKVEDASVTELTLIKGMGGAKTAQLKAALELGRRLLQHKQEDSSVPSFKSSREVYEHYRPKLYGLKKERFLCVLLDVKNRVFKETIVSEGTLTSSPVHPREVFRLAIKEAAASVIFVHNHPSGDPNPSRDDIEITRRLVETGKVVGINVLDHVVVSDGKYMSLMEQGFL